VSQAQQLLDQIQSPARIDAAQADPAAYAERLAAELGPAATLDELDARDARLRQAVIQLDAAIERVARIRFDHALAGDAALAAPTRKVFAATIASYAGRLELLEARARDAAARGGARDPDGVASRLGAAASGVLALRAAMRASVLAVIRDLAAAAAPAADRCARDRALDEPVRRRWSAARRDLEAVASRPEHILAAAMAARLAALPEQLDEPDPGGEPTFADMIELD
jgi:hypothetical protein